MPRADCEPRLRITADSRVPCVTEFVSPGRRYALPVGALPDFLPDNGTGSAECRFEGVGGCAISFGVVGDLFWL